MQPPTSFDSVEGEAGPPSVTFASGGLSWTRARTPRVLSRIAMACYVVGVLGDIAMLRELPTLELLKVVSVFAWPIFIASYIVSLSQSAFAASLEVSATELVIIRNFDSRRVIPRSRIAGALVVERAMFGGHVATVEIELTSGDRLTARLADPRSAQAIVSALGFGVGGKRVHASLAKPSRRLLHPLLGIAAYCLAFAVMGIVNELLRSSAMVPGIYVFQSILLLGMYAVLKRLFRAPEITVGDDGVLLTHRFGSELVPRSEIALVMTAAGSSVIIERKNGQRTAARGILLDEARCQAVVRAVEERAAPSGAGADRFTHYERKGRALREWREHLARSMNEASYRANAATVDEAALVLRSAQASPEQRVGAALALRIAGQPKERIRVAVEAAVDAPTREALEAVADTEDDDAAIEKALRRLA
jgi:hypothetical protein